MKKTGWIDWKEKPVHKGWYQVIGYFYETHPRKGISYRYWSGKEWKWRDYRDLKMKPAAFGGYYSQDKTFMVETNFYSIGDGKLLWSGTTSSLNPTTLEKTMDQIISANKYELQKKGFLKK